MIFIQTTYVYLAYIAGKDIAFYVRLAKSMISYNKKISEKFTHWVGWKGTNDGVYIDLLHTNYVRSV